MPGRARASKCRSCDKALKPCDKALTYEDKSIECECCVKWYHATCQKLEEPKFNAITQYNLHWFCSNCDGAASTLYLHCTNLQAEHVKLKADIATLNSRMDHTEELVSTGLDEKINSKVEAKVKDMIEKNEFNFPVLQPPAALPPVSPNTNRANITTVVNEALKEKEDIQNRKMNLVIHNLEEPTDDATEDALLKTLINDKLGIEDEITMTDITRLGNRRDDGLPRMLKIELQTLSMKRKILSCATKLRQLPEQDKFAKVFVKPDLTKKQQQESKNLYEILKKTRIDDPDNRYKIYRGNIIRTNV